MSRPAAPPDGRIRACIDLEALQHNFRLAHKRAPEGGMTAVIKANAYGHGLIPVAEALREADRFAVTDLNEAQRLATAGLDRPILILQGFMHRDEVPLIVEQGFELVVHSLEQLELLEQELGGRRLTRPLTIWLKADSGMGRLGIPAEDYPRAWRRLRARPWCGELTLITHLANASLPDAPLTAEQLTVFRRLRGELGANSASIASSAGILDGLALEAEQLRPGLMLYGSSPFPFELPEWRAERLGLLPVMTLESKLIAVREFKEGDNIGYCSQYLCERDMRVGIVACGYADGYPAHAPNGTPVLVEGKRSRTLGRVSMDMMAVDLSDIPQATTGSPVTLWGDEDLPVDEVAAVTGVISYSLLCGVAPRVSRFYG